MNSALILLLVMPALVLGTFKLPATRLHAPTRYTLSHSSVVLNQHQLRHSLNHDLTFTAPLSVGNHVGFSLALKVDGLDYQMSMDTGSGDVFIKGEKTHGNPQVKYKSPTDYTKLPQQRIGYLDGFLECYVKTLGVQFNNKTFDTELLVAYQADPNFDDQAGLIGLSYPSTARHQPTFIQTLIKNKIVDTYAFGMNLNLIQEGRSFVTFGDSDPTLYTGKLTEFDIKSRRAILIDMNWIKIGDGSELKVNTALLDTGNTCISIPSRFAIKVLDQFNKGKNFCSFWLEQNAPQFSLLICKVYDFNELPTIHLDVQGQKYQIQKEFYLSKCSVDPKDQSKQRPHFCETYIESVEGQDTLFLGDGFFNRFYTFFDLENHKVGIAQNKEELKIRDIFKVPSAYDPNDWRQLEEQLAQRKSANSTTIVSKEEEKQDEGNWFINFFKKIFG